MAKTPPLIDMRHVTKQYPLGSEDFYQALHDITLTIREGEFVSIMGPSGSGKSTTMHIMGALDTPTGGTYLFKGRDISSYTPDDLARIRNKEIGFVFQSYNLLPRTTVFKNVERPMVYGGVSPEDRRTRAMEAMRMVHIDDKADNLSNQLSGGQTQRVAIARALVMNPSIILADEPTGNLDSKTAHEIMTFLKDLNTSGRTVVVITHDATVAGYAKRQIKIVDGRIVSDKGSAS